MMRNCKLSCVELRCVALHCLRPDAPSWWMMMVVLGCLDAWSFGASWSLVVVQGCLSVNREWFESAV